jgi:hypothetical protein
VDKNIISQCNTNIILKVTNPNDLKAIIQSVEGLTTQAADEIQRLPIGVALIAGGSLQMPILAEIRTRETSHGGRSVSISKSNQEIYKEPVIKTEPQTSYPTQSEVDQTINYQPSKNTVTEKAKQVTRVANRLGWVKSSDPEEAIKILAEEAQKMDENVYKYLESLSNLGKKYCFENNPQCMKCPMNNGCNYQLKLYKKPRKGLFRK